MGNACVRTSATSLPIQATCPFEAMKLAACGCAESNVGESWVCTSQTSASSVAGTARKCGVGTATSCARGNSTDTAEYCSPAGRQQLFYDESRPPPGPQFTCCIGIKVQILTYCRRRIPVNPVCRCRRRARWPRGCNVSHSNR
jgi:hypothetical protein